MMFKVALIVTACTATVYSMPNFEKRSPNMPMPPGMPAPPMSPPGMIVESDRFKRQAPETTPPPMRFARSPQDTTPPSRFVRSPQDTTPPSRVARSVMFDSQDMPKTVAQEAFYSKITTINGDK